MPSHPIPCAACGRPRRQGGSSKPGGLCRLCFHQSKRVAKPTYRCVAGCLRTVSGANRMCVSCSAAHRTGPRRGPSIRILPRMDRTAEAPTSSWWAGVSREQFSAALAAQLPRLQLVPATKADELKYLNL